MNVYVQWNGKQNFTGSNKDDQRVLISPTESEKEMISPPDLLLMSLGSCTGLFVMPAAKSLNVTLEDFHVSVQGVKSNQPPKLFHQINIHVDFKGELNEEQAAEIIEKSHEKCFILHSLNSNIAIESTFTINK